MAQATTEQLLEAAKSGDYSAIMNTPDRYGQIPANMTTARDQLKSLQNQGAQLLKQENAMKGVTTGDYSGASKDAPMLYEHTDYDRTLGTGGADGVQKGYAVYGIQEILAQFRYRSGSISYDKISSAYYQWKLYREFENLNYAKCIYYMITWAWNGLFKWLQ